MATLTSLPSGSLAGGVCGNRSGISSQTSGVKFAFECPSSGQGVVDLGDSGREADQLIIVVEFARPSAGHQDAPIIEKRRVVIEARPS